MAKRDGKGYIRYSPEELNQIPSYDSRADGSPWGYTTPTGKGAAGGTFDGTLFGPRPAAANQEGRPIQLTPSQVIGITPSPPTDNRAAAGYPSGGFSGPSPASGITLGGEIGADMEDFHWSTWSEEHSC